MPDSRAKEAEASGASRIVTGLRRHFLVYLCAAPALFLIDRMVSDGWWFHWPVLVWGVALLGHYPYAKIVRVDDEWARRRARELRLKSYDLGHIGEIERSYGEGRPRRRGPGAGKSGD